MLRWVSLSTKIEVKNMKKFPEKYMKFLLTNIDKDVNIKYVVGKKS